MVHELHPLLLLPHLPLPLPLAVHHLLPHAISIIAEIAAQAEEEETQRRKY